MDGSAVGPRRVATIHKVASYVSGVAFKRGSTVIIDWYYYCVF